MAKWYCSVVIGMLMEGDPREWGELHVVAERGVNCEHMQVLVTNILQKHWEWQENRWDAGALGIFRYKTACMASAFGVAKPGLISDVLTLLGTNRHVVAALLEDEGPQRVSLL